MADRAVTVEIDRIRLSGMDLRPEHAARMRELLEVELARVLSRERFGEGIKAGETSHVKAPALHLSAGHSESEFAGQLAQSIAQGLLSSK